MTTETFKIQPFSPKDATRSEYEAMNRHINAMRRERLPDDPPIPLEETIQSMQNIPPFVYERAWVAWNADRSEIIAESELVMLRMEENKHLAQVDISVFSAYRRQGLGRRMLALIAEAARAENRSHLITGTVDRIPAGEAFLLRIGAKKGLESHVNQLRIGELDRGLIERWLERGKENAPEYELGFWDGPYPEEQLSAIALLNDLTNQQPRGDLAIEDMHITPEQLRQSERSFMERGIQRWTFYVIEKATSNFAGYTEVGWSPNRPEILDQWMTGVLPEYRNKGLGRWLKAAMLDKVLKERPQVKVVRTGNADSNAPMLKINQELGFKPYMASAVWQVEVERVLEYIANPIQA
jgi:mycothiol synthase